MDGDRNVGRCRWKNWQVKSEKKKKRKKKLEKSSLLSEPSQPVHSCSLLPLCKFGTEVAS